ncbi:hypothetical protein HDU87_008279 [Geranomyces variabilis]|uniref:Uncharacterized protein n=1 Tax=Geranomyces variabilis TaxID=109894 RepID=A0AAD5XJX6_9FUNG|nr:hypothetical protein HDU87_008279 [Geranomyces variabilis]
MADSVEPPDDDSRAHQRSRANAILLPDLPTTALVGSHTHSQNQLKRMKRRKFADTAAPSPVQSTPTPVGPVLTTASEMAVIVPGGNAAYMHDYSILLSPWEGEKKAKKNSVDFLAIDSGLNGAPALRVQHGHVRSAERGSGGRKQQSAAAYYLQRRAGGAGGGEATKPKTPQRFASVLSAAFIHEQEKRYASVKDPYLQVIAHTPQIERAPTAAASTASPNRITPLEGTAPGIATGQAPTPFLGLTWPAHGPHTPPLLTPHVAAMTVHSALFRMPDPQIPSERPMTRDARRWLVEHLQAGSMMSLADDEDDDDDSADTKVPRRWGVGLAMRPVVVQRTSDPTPPTPPLAPPPKRKKKKKKKRENDTPPAAPADPATLPTIAVSPPSRPKTKHAPARPPAPVSLPSAPSLASLPSMPSLPGLPPTVYLPTLTNHIRPQTRQATPMSKKAKALEQLLLGASAGKKPETPESRLASSDSHHQQHATTSLTLPHLASPPRHLSKLLKTSGFNSPLKSDNKYTMDFG